MRVPPHFEAQVMGSLLTADEVAVMCRVTTRTVYNWLRAGELKGNLQRQGPKFRRLIPFWSLYEFQQRRADAFEAKITEGMKKLSHPVKSNA